MSQSPPTIRSILLVDVENSCHTYVKDVRCYSDSLLVICVVPKSYDEAKLANLKPTIQPLVTAPSTSSTSFYSQPFEHRQPRNDWVWFVRAASDAPQAVDIHLQYLAEWCIKEFNHSVSRSCAPYNFPTDEKMVFECPISSPTSQLNRMTFRSELALFIVAGEDKRYSALVAHLQKFNTQIKNSKINEISFKKGGVQGVFTDGKWMASSYNDDVSLEMNLPSITSSSGWSSGEKTTAGCHWCKIIFNTVDECRTHFRKLHPFCRGCKSICPTQEIHTNHGQVQSCPYVYKYDCRTSTCAAQMKKHIDDVHGTRIKAEEARKRAEEEQVKKEQLQRAEQESRSCPKCRKVCKTVAAKDQHWKAKCEKL